MKHRSNPDRFVYPHPIIKTFTSIPEQEQACPPHAYQSSHTADPNSIPQKVLRSTHLNPLLGSNFSLILQPLHPKVEISCYDSKQILKCKKCGCSLNTVSLEKLSLLQHRCKYCQTVNQSEFQSGRYVDSNLYDEVLEPEAARQHKTTKILFVLQANEYLYNKQVSTSIFQCLRALAPTKLASDLDKSISAETQRTDEGQLTSNQCQEVEDYWSNNLKIGFMFYDGQMHYMMNMLNNQIVVVKPSEFEGQDDMPLQESELVQPLRDINLDELQELVHEIMYAAYEMKAAKLVQTLRYCDKLARKYQIESKLFVCSHDVSSLAPRPKGAKKPAELPRVQADPRVEITLVNNALFPYLSSLGLADNIGLSYEYKWIRSGDVYYGLYHSITQQKYYNVQIEINTSSLVCPLKTKLVLPVLSSNNPVVLDFSVPHKYKPAQLSSLEFQDSIGKQAVQIRVKLGESVRTITYGVPKINLSVVNEPYLLNDEAFFYVIVCKMLADKGVTSLKKALFTKSKEIINKIYSETNDLSIPKNLTNFFMYAFMVMESNFCEKKNFTYLEEKALFSREGLETIAKLIYPKVYQFYPVTQPLKFKPKSFMQNTVRLVDNGKFLGVVIGQEVPASTLQQLFNSGDIKAVSQLRQIPQLDNQMNNKLRKTVSMLRELNQLYYLPLKIIQYDSMEFQLYYGDHLYTEEAHRQFFKRCVQN